MLPLDGLRIVVTRAAEQAEELAQPLRERGAKVILLPAIAIVPPENPEALADARARLDTYDWIVFTSANAVRALGPKQGRARVAAVGAATRAIAEGQGWRVDLTPETYVAEALVEALGEEDLRGKRILIPSAAVTRDVVREELARRGAMVEVVEAYRNALPAEAAERAREVLRTPFPDWITFASSSAVVNLLRVTDAATLGHSKIASIGPVTSKTARAHGLAVEMEAQPHNVAGLVAGIEKRAALEH